MTAVTQIDRDFLKAKKTSSKKEKNSYHALHLGGELPSTLLFQFGQDAALMVVVSTLVKEQPSSQFFPITKKRNQR